MTAWEPASFEKPGGTPFESVIALGQGVFYMISGLWPWVSRRSFESVTGPKRDWWLVQTVGLLVSVIGGTLLMAGIHKRVTPEVKAVAIGGAASLATVDLIFTAQKRISPVYLLDAAAEIGLISLWFIARKNAVHK